MTEIIQNGIKNKKNPQIIYHNKIQTQKQRLGENSLKGGKDRRQSHVSLL